MKLLQFCETLTSFKPRRGTFDDTICISLPGQGQAQLHSESFDTRNSGQMFLVEARVLLPRRN
jgi:hypothetical protein